MGTQPGSGFHCSICGLHHPSLPLSFSSKFPVAAGAVPKDEVDRRIVMTPDQCVIDERFYYLRGRFAIPIHGLDEPFIWGVWARVSPQDFFRTNQLWSDPARVNEPPYQGLLNNHLPLYGDTMNLPVTIETKAVGRRPHFFPVDANHPLAIEQRNGISMDRVIRIAEKMLHPAPPHTEP